MQKIDTDTYLIEKKTVKRLIEQPPLNADLWLSTRKATSLKGKIILTVDELMQCFKWGMASFEDTQTPEQSFNDFLQDKGINI